MEDSGDDGSTWQNAEALSGVFVEQLAVSGTTLYAARGDGLWRRSISSAGVAPPLGGKGLRFAMAGPQPFGSQARLRFDLPEAGTASIAVFDVSGRAVGPRIVEWWPAGVRQVFLDARQLSPGVYAAVLTAGNRREVVRLVHTR